MEILKSQLPCPEDELRAEIEVYRAARAQEGVTPELPPHDLARLVVEKGVELVVIDDTPQPPEPSPPPSQVDELRAAVAAVNTQTQSPRWVRQGLLGLGELVDLVREAPEVPELTPEAKRLLPESAVAALDAARALSLYLRAIPPCGPGMAKLSAVESKEIDMRRQIDSLSRSA